MKKICCFAGHSTIANSNLSSAVYEKCEELIKDYGVNCFWVGNYGEFDSLAAGCVRRLKEKYADIELCLVIPYVTKSIRELKEIYYEDFDCILIAEMSENTLARFKIVKCNEYMIDKSDYIITYIDHTYGGAAHTWKYAIKKNHIKVFNLGELKE